MPGLRAWLERSRELGFLGPGPVDDHITHARGFAAAFAEPPASVLDLGSGGGLPGLVLAEGWPTTTFTLLDSNERRTTFLTEAVADLGWGDRVHVHRARAEVAGRDPALRSGFQAVVSRSFAPPPVVAECAAPFLAVGGSCVVSEPPDAPERWPETGLAMVGLALGERYEAEAGYVVLRQTVPCPDRYPRREGVPGKRPLW